MAAKDIRRQVEDTAPTIFQRQGVQNNALAEAITGVGGSLIELDVALAKERLGKELDQSRSEFLVGEVTDQSDGNDPKIQEQLDRELAPFKAQLSKMSNAEQQGLLRSDRFKMQADAILQSHIARRPGLAPEFRELHAQYTGGAIIETIMRQEQEQFDAAMRQSGKSAENDEQNRKFQLNAMKDAGFAAEAGALAYASPEAVNEAFIKLSPMISRQERTIKQANTLKAAAEGVDAGHALDKPASLQVWQSQFDLSMEGVAKTLRESSSVIATADEEVFAAKVGEWRMALAQVKSNLFARSVQLGLKPDDIAGQMSVIAKMEEDGSKLLDGTIALDQRKKRVETFKYQSEAALQKDYPLMASIVALEQTGAHEVVKWMYEQNPTLGRQTAQSMMEFVVNKGGGDPKEVVGQAGGFSQQLLKGMFPDGSATKSPDMDMAAASDLLVNFGKAFIVTPNDQFKLKPYTEWMEELLAYADPLSKLLAPAAKQDLTEAVRISAHKSLRVAYLSLLANSPSLKGHLKWSQEATEEPLVYDGDDSVLEKQVDQANQQLAWGNTLRVLRSVGGYGSEQDAHVHVLKSSDELMGQENLGVLKAQERASKAKQAQGATPAQAGDESGGYSPGEVVPDPDTNISYRFQGGDYTDPSNWVPVE